MATASGRGRRDLRRRLPEALVRLGWRAPKIVLAFWALLCALAVPGVLALEVETSTDSILDLESEQWRFYQTSQQRFGGDEIIVVMVESQSPYDAELFAEVQRLTRIFQRLPSVRRVDSLATVPLVERRGNGELSLDPALAGEEPLDAAGAAALAGRLAADRIAPRALISDDGRAAALNVVLKQGSEAEYARVFAAIDEATQGLDARVSGVPVFRQQATLRTSRELVVFIPLVVAAAGLLLFGIFRTLRGVAVPLMVSGIGTWLVVGTMGGLGVPMTISTVILPPVLLALGCAYCMHLLAAAEDVADLEKLREGLLAVALPVALSGLTTAVGFTAVSSVRVQAVRDVSTFGALGVLIVTAAALTAGTAALRLWPRRGRARPPLLPGLLGPEAAALLVDFALRNRKAVFAVWGSAALATALGLSALHVETDVVVWFSKSDPIRQSYDQIREHLSGISPMNVVIEAPEGRSVSELEVVQALDALSEYLRADPAVGKVISLADMLRQLHAGFGGNGEAALPDSDEMIDQYLLLLESNPYLFDLVMADRSATNVLLRLDDNGSSALLAVADEAVDWWERNGPPGFRANTTGIMYEVARSQDRLSTGQMQGLAFAVAVIGVVLLGIFVWPRLALVSLVPNMLPVLMAFGIMGLLGVALDAGTVFVGCLALGIAVDDTIHEVTEFSARRRLGFGNRLALIEALGRVIRPVVYTTAVTSVGFAVLGFSGFAFTRNLGLLTAGVMILCLAANLVLLPALLGGLGAPTGRRPQRSEAA